MHCKPVNNAMKHPCYNLKLIISHRARYVYYKSLEGSIIVSHLQS